MTAIASVLTPFDATPPIELGNAWRKRLLPVGEISYQGRTLHFTRAYLQGLVSAWQDGAYDQVPLQFADAANTHTNDPERTRGRITSMQLADDGLYVTAELTERGQRTLQDNPYLGVSARIVEQYARSDGKFYPAAIQHVLATLDPRIPGLGAWEPVAELANSSAVTIDLSNYSFAGQPASYGSPALPGLDELSDQELADLLEVMDETGMLDGGDGDSELSDDELEMLMQAAGNDADPFTEFDTAFAARAQADADREDARAAAIVEDTLHPARREEDKIARIMARAGQGLYHGQQADFAAEQAAVELAAATGRGNCGPADDYGRCSSRFHDLECSHGLGTDWQASGPHPETYAASLASFAAAIELAGPKGYSHGWVKEALGLGSATEAAARGAGLPLEQPGLQPHQQRVYHKMRAIGHSHSRALAFARRAGAAAGRALDVGGATRVFNQANTVHGDPDDLDEPWYEVPQQTVELAHELAIDWGLDSAPGAPDAEAYLDLLRSPAAPVTVADAMYESMGTGVPAAQPTAQYPGIAELRAQMGL